MMAQVKPFLDRTVGRLLSRKLMVWMTATYFMLVGDALTSSDWVAVSLAYIGIQGVADIAATWSKGNNANFIKFKKIFKKILGLVKM